MHKAKTLMNLKLKTAVIILIYLNAFEINLIIFLIKIIVIIEYVTLLRKSCIDAEMDVILRDLAINES